MNQMIVHRVARSSFDSAVAAARAKYQKRRDAMIAALETCGVPDMSWTRPDGGFFLWGALPEGIDSARLLEKAMAANVAFVPGEAFYPHRRPRSTLRLSFSLTCEAQIHEGIARLCDLLEADIRQRPSRAEALAGL